jgi:hypothetical protein
LYSLGFSYFKLGNKTAALDTVQRLRKINPEKANALASFISPSAPVAGSGAVGGWVPFSRPEHATFYYDPATIRKAGNKVKMWTLTDFKTALTGSGKAYMSGKSQMEFDCKEEQSRLLYLSTHSGPMGGGEVVSTFSDPGKWEPVGPGTIGEEEWKLACKKK